ncbi:MAG: transposase [Candidatus Goldiibacteriota bacterium]
MARVPRLEFEGAVYHVFTRGNQKQIIYRDDYDRKKFLAILRKAKEKYDFLLYAYVLMPNHFHFVIETKSVKLSVVMHWIKLKYTKYFARKYKYTGHLFQNPYKCLIVEKESYFTQVIKYVHLNPARAGLEDDLRRYAWSSHIEYLRKSNGGIADKEYLYLMLDEEIKNSIRRYVAYMDEEFTDEKEIADVIMKNGHFLGEIKYVRENQNKMYSVLNVRDIKKMKEEEKCLKALKKIKKLSDSYSGPAKRDMIIAMLCTHYEMSPKVVAKCMNCNVWVVYKVLKRKKI